MEKLHYIFSRVKIYFVNALLSFCTSHILQFMDIVEFKKSERYVSLEDLPSLVFILKEVCNIHQNTIRVAIKLMLMCCLLGVTLTCFQFNLQALWELLLTIPLQSSSLQTTCSPLDNKKMLTQILKSSVTNGLCELLIQVITLNQLSRNFLFICYTLTVDFWGNSECPVP
jgi:hypothetical protein